ncbi:hypothetical protein AXG93_1660s1610 [Marchantia polymorpha subsp. ruderalis]|uniref:GOLD domain-containing protein n=1 Tax=Marchantia polymorpha subsp. ruderalis TaxID=1480154 RepID=A0A176VST7_MARPO|nr:hypothetical protein AXG93_1660s1610 [Marchantia polymorpha subsp. ruderalis]
MASTAGLVPITRHFLAKYYEKYPYSPLNKELPSIIDSLKEKFNRMDLEYQKASATEELLKFAVYLKVEHFVILTQACQMRKGNKQMMEELQIIVPHKIDENLWKNREQIEEILHLFEEGSWPKALKGQSASTNVVKALERLGGILKSLLKDIEKFQVANSDRVYNMVLTYMPQDFRCSLIKQQRERSEKRRQAEVEALVNAGGSIREKFVLLWKQQMERRRQLAQLGSGSGLYKQLVKFLVGVPLVLLEFVKQINDHQGQTEDMLAQLEKSVDAYVTDFKHYLKFMGEVFENSPFLISAEEAGLTEEKFDDFEETPIPPGKFHEVAVKVECEGSIVAWDFRLTSGKDVGFHVDFINESGSKVPMVPYKRYEANQPNQGDFPSPFVGHYKLVWDNSYSTFYRKIVRHKLDVIPPVAPQSPDMSLVEEDEQT